MAIRKDQTKERRVFRYTVEIRDLKSDERRLIPLCAFQRIHLSRRKGGPEVPAEEFLEVRDRDWVLEAKSFEELRDRLRKQFPDEGYERRLHVVRDREAEERRERGICGLVTLLAEAVADEYIRGSS